MNEYPLQAQNQIVKINYDEELPPPPPVYNQSTNNIDNNSNYNIDDDRINNDYENDNPKPITFTNRKETVFDRNKRTINKPQIQPKKYSNKATSPIQLFYEENKQKNYEIQQQQLKEKKLTKETMNNLSYSSGYGENDKNENKDNLNSINNANESIISENKNNEDENNLLDSLLPIFSDFEIDYNTRIQKYNNINTDINVISSSSVGNGERREKEKDKRMSPMTYIKYNYIFCK